jgi:hypothetical protein
MLYVVMKSFTSQDGCVHQLSHPLMSSGLPGAITMAFAVRGYLYLFFRNGFCGATYKLHKFALQSCFMDRRYM